MIIQKKIKKERIKNKDFRNLLTVILGEFDRMNDGKAVDDKTALQVLKKMIKSYDDTLKLDIKDREKYIKEKEFLEYLWLALIDGFVNIATEDDMRETIEEVLGLHDFKNNMQAMKPCIESLEKRGLEVDKGKLNKILKEKELYDEFYQWFKSLLRSTGSCFERDVLRNSKEDLWNSWKKYNEEYQPITKK